MNMNQNNRNRIIVHLSILFLILLAAAIVYGEPTGSTVTYVDNSTKGDVTPDGRNDSKGTITTVQLNSEQQNLKWKAYVGNVSSTFVLDDADDYSIYQWSMDSFTGQVYMTRNNSVDWTSISCAQQADKETEDTSINHDSTKADSVNRTFTDGVHRQFDVGTTPIGEDSCFSTVTWQNDAAQVHVSGSTFEEVLLWDGDDMVYTTFVENDQQGYRADATTYDFQGIVPDDGTPSNPALTYYFYIELS